MRGAPGLERHAFERGCLCKIEMCVRPPRRRLLQERMRFSQRLARRDLTEQSKSISLVLAFSFCDKAHVFADPLRQSMRARPPAVHRGVLRANHPIAWLHVCSTGCSLSFRFAMTFRITRAITKGDTALRSSRFTRKHELLLNCFSVGIAVFYKWALRQVIL